LEWYRGKKKKENKKMGKMAVGKWVKTETPKGKSKRKS